MRLLLDENISSAVVQSLREKGHDLVSVKESMRGQNDAVILARAQAEHRILVTQDKDFGEMAFRWRLPADGGVVLFRLTGSDPDRDNRRIVDIIESRADWAGNFAVVTDKWIRIRPLPP